MVTFLEAGLFAQFNSLFVFLFVFIVTYAMLTKIKILGDNSAVNAIVAIILALIFASSSTTTRVFELAAPWLVLVFIVLLFISIIFMFLGAEGNEMPISPKNPAATTIIFIFIVIIFVISIGQAQQENAEARGEIDEVQESATLSFAGRIGETLRHPAVLGMIFVFLIATFAIMMISSER